MKMVVMKKIVIDMVNASATQATMDWNVTLASQATLIFPTVKHKAQEQEAWKRRQLGMH